MVYDIGDKSLLFKYISLNLKNLYMSSLPVSDKYTLDLAKCIYDFLKTYYPQQSITDPYNASMVGEDIATYYLKGVVEYTPLKYIIILPEYDLGDPKQLCGVYKYGGKVTDIPLYNFNVENLYCIIGANTQWEIVPETPPYYNTDGLWQYLPEDGVRFMDTPEDIVEENCVYIGSNSSNEYYKHFYIKSKMASGYVDVTESISGYIFLTKTFTPDSRTTWRDVMMFTWGSLSNLRWEQLCQSYEESLSGVLDDIDFSDYYSENSHNLSFGLYDIGATIHPQIITNNTDKTNPVYDVNQVVLPKTVDDINYNNLVHWYINDVVIQYLQPIIVISENNSLDDIAQAQYMMKNYDYIPTQLGKIDNNFTYSCYSIQKYLQKRNPIIACTGYFDIFVESYVRSLGEVRK